MSATSPKPDVPWNPSLVNEHQRLYMEKSTGFKNGKPRMTFLQLKTFHAALEELLTISREVEHALYLIDSGQGREARELFHRLEAQFNSLVKRYDSIQGFLTVHICELHERLNIKLRMSVTGRITKTISGIGMTNGNFHRIQRPPRWW